MTCHLPQVITLTTLLLLPCVPDIPVMSEYSGWEKSSLVVAVAAVHECLDLIVIKTCCGVAVAALIDVMVRELAKEILRHAPPHRLVPIMWAVKSHPSTEVCMDYQPGVVIRLEDSPSCSCAVIQVLSALRYSHGRWEVWHLSLITHQLCNKNFLTTVCTEKIMKSPYNAGVLLYKHELDVCSLNLVCHLLDF